VAQRSGRPDTLANTGISAAATDIGTFPVYLRLRNQVMTGTDPSGAHYADPVQFVAYFTGGDAITTCPAARMVPPESRLRRNPHRSGLGHLAVHVLRKPGDGHALSGLSSDAQGEDASNVALSALR